MRERLLRAYVALVCLAGGATLSVGLLASSPEGEWAWWGVALLLVAILVAEGQSVPLPMAGAVSVATIPQIPHTEDQSREGCRTRRERRSPARAA